MQPPVGLTKRGHTEQEPLLSRYSVHVCVYKYVYVQC